MADANVEGVQVKKKYTKAGSEPKRGDTPIMHEVKMGEGGQRPPTEVGGINTHAR